MTYHILRICLLGFVVTSSLVVAENDTEVIPEHPLNSGRTSYLDRLKSRAQNLGILNTNSSQNEDFQNIYDALKDWVNPQNLKMVSDIVEARLDKMLRQLNLTTPCINDTMRIVRHLSKNSSWHGDDWAVQMIDSIGKPGPSLTEFRLNWVGNYDQCRAVYAPEDKKLHIKGFRGSYTDVKIGFGMGDSPFAQTMQWGLCVPDSCSAVEVYVMLNKALGSISSPNATMKPVVYMPDIRTDEREYTTASKAAIGILTIIALLMIIGTVYDVIFIQRIKWTAQRGRGVSMKADNLAYQNGDSPNLYTISPGETSIGASEMPSEPSPRDNKLLISDTRTNTGPGLLSKVILAFSVYTNTFKFMSTHQAEGSLSAIHGIRFLSMSWVILGHTYFFGTQFFVNPMVVKPLFQRWTFDAIGNALVSVDTFFTLSGLLTSYLVVKQMKKSSWKINWGLFYFHRFWRLTPPYMLAILLTLGLQRFFGSGAEWATVQPQDKDWCEKNWWTNLLYINNVYGIKELCFGHSWFLANDMQFYILSPLMLIPLYFNKFVGLVSCGIFLLANIITTAYLSVQNEWPSIALGATMFDPNAHVDVVGFMRDYYFAPWCRIGPFVVGIAVGYFLAIHKGRIPLNRTVNVIGWVLATGVGLAIVYGLREEISGTPGPVGVDAFYNSCARSAWGACVCWVIVSCTSGYGGFVNTILSWSPFVVLGRLTYMAYLIHPTVLSIYFQNMDQLFYVNDLNIVVTYLGILVLTNMTAFVLMLGLESPMIGLEKALLSPKKE